MIKRGRKRWVPRNSLQAINDIKLNYHIQQDSKALEKMAELSRVGMEVERMRDRMTLQDIFKKKRKR